MLAFDLLDIFLPNPVPLSVQMTFVGAPAIRVIARNAKRLHQCFQRQKDDALASSEHIGQHLARVMIDRVPKPSRIRFALTFRTLFPESMKVFREVLSNPLGLAIVTPPERVSMLLPDVSTLV